MTNFINLEKYRALLRPPAANPRKRRSTMAISRRHRHGRLKETDKMATPKNDDELQRLFDEVRSLLRHQPAPVKPAPDPAEARQRAELERLCAEVLELLAAGYSARGRSD